MHSFGVTDGSNEGQTPTSSSQTESNGMFSNGDVQNVANGTATSNGTTNSGQQQMSNGADANGINNNYTNGANNNNNDDDGDLDGLDGPYMNGNSHNNNNNNKRPHKRDKPSVIRSPSDLDIIRLIGQQLCIMGLDQTAEQLIKESGCRLDHPTAAKFRSYVMNGEWEKADATLKELQNHLVNPKYLVKMKFLMLEQKFLESIEDGREIDALKCLQNEITKLKYNMDKLPIICSYLFTNSVEELKKVANWDGKGHVSRAKLMEKLQNYLPATIMLPPRRLQCLLNQAIEFQKERCPYHNIRQENGFSDFSLLVDHLCCKDDLPSETLQTLTEHKDEVWFCRFSNDGLRLATGSKDGNLTIWNIDPETFQLTLKYTLGGHASGVSYFAWSPDDHYILALGPEECSEFWIWDTHTGTLKTKNCHENDDSLHACAWHKDGKKFVAGGTRGQFYQIDINGTVIKTWEGVRVISLAYRQDGKTVLAADTHHRIRGYNFEDQTNFNLIKEEFPIISLATDESCRLALINLENQGIHLWDIEDRILLRKFQGVQQGLYVNHSCFGGVDQLFVACGSEDNKVLIWHLKREHPISVLKGHTRSVNCVHWNPRYPHLLASASDDTTVRIWCAKNRHLTPKTKSMMKNMETNNNNNNNNNNNHKNNHVDPNAANNNNNNTSNTTQMSSTSTTSVTNNDSSTILILPSSNTSNSSASSTSNNTTTTTANVSSSSPTTTITSSSPSLSSSTTSSSSSTTATLSLSLSSIRHASSGGNYGGGAGSSGVQQPTATTTSTSSSSSSSRNFIFTPQLSTTISLIQQQQSNSATPATGAAAARGNGGNSNSQQQSTSSAAANSSTSSNSSNNSTTTPQQQRRNNFSLFVSDIGSATGSQQQSSTSIDASSNQQQQQQQSQPGSSSVISDESSSTSSSTSPSTSSGGSSHLAKI